MWPLALTPRTNDPTDQDVIRAVLAGDRDGFRVLVERYHRSVFRTMLGLCGSPQDAEDIVQETFVRAYAALASFRLDMPFYPWLHAIAHNAYVTRATQAARRRTVSLEAEVETEGAAGRDESAAWLVDPTEGPAATAERRDERATLWAAVRALPDEFRRVFVMRNVHEMSYLEICQATGLPIGTVKSRLARARERLAVRLADELRR